MIEPYIFTFMKKSLLILLLLASLSAFSQSTDPGSIYNAAHELVKQGKFDNAVLLLDKGLQQYPNDITLQKELLFATYLKRDFARARSVGKQLVEQSNADVQTFQMYGLVLKAIAENKEAEKMYKRALKLYPNEGIMYSEYGSLLAEKDKLEAIKIFENGVEADANHSSNYYHLAKLYASHGEILWSILYGEIFLNLESFTQRSTEMKNILLDQYKLFYAAPSAAQTYQPAKATEFTQAVAAALKRQQPQATEGVNPEALTAIRTRFILDWYSSYADRYPFRLFEHHQQLLQEGYYEAYNQWLFGPPTNLAAYQLWQQYHPVEYNSFLSFVKGRVFKIPAGQYYIASGN